MMILRFLCLPFLVLGGIILGGLGMLVYWYYWTFKKDKLYLKYGDR